MLTLSSLLFIAVSIVNLDGACHRYPQGQKESDTNVQSSSASRSREVTRRLKIFESITKSEDQRNDDSSVSIEYEQGISAPDDDQTVNEILHHSLVELTEMLRTLDLHDPSKAMRIPVHVIPVQSSLMMFQSLLMMLSNPKERRSPTSWQQYLMKSIRKKQCSEIELFTEFDHNFKCDAEVPLRVIMLVGHGYEGSFNHLNLLMIPNTVMRILLRDTKLKTISEWTDLKGNSLTILDLGGNPELKLKALSHFLDVVFSKTFFVGICREKKFSKIQHLRCETEPFDALKGGLNYLPLEHLVVSVRTIKMYIEPWAWLNLFPRIVDWIKASTLTSLKIKGTIRRRPVVKANSVVMGLGLLIKDRSHHLLIS